MVHQGKPTISNLVLSPPMNKTLVSATLVVEPECEFACEIGSPFFGCCCLRTKQDNETKKKKEKKEVRVFMTGYLRQVTDPVSDPSHTD